MYTRQSNAGQAVEWNPDDADLAAQALANVAGAPPESASEAKQNARVDLGEKRDVARKVREEFQRLKEAQTA
jgi:hypothetical protein